MEIEVLGKTYEVLQVIPKANSSHDLFVCKAPAGYKECFQRIDIGRKPKIINLTDAVEWTSEEIEIVKNALNKGMKIKEIPECRGLDRHTKNAVRSKATTLRRRMRWKEQMEKEMCVNDKQ